MAETLVPPEAKALIGAEALPVTGYPVSDHEIRRYCYAADDLNPLYVDEAAAREGPHGGIIAPPLFFTIPFARDAPLSQIREDGLAQTGQGLPRVPLNATRTMAGGVEVELLRTVRPGDLLTQRRRIADVYEREGSAGPLAFTITEAEYVNQRGEVVAIERTTTITR
ncbi:MAG: MaoC family dehydratase N-terminal domain-containing protein [Dehalococcoidia bacterium]